MLWTGAALCQDTENTGDVGAAVDEQQTAATATADAEASVKTGKPKPPPGPLSAIDFMRYDDDFSYLNGPAGSYEPSIFDPIKNIHLDDDFTLMFGGDIRWRFESKRNEFLRPGSQPHDDFLLERYALYADLKYRDLARVFVEGIHADVHGRQDIVFFIHRNRFDLHQAFLDVRVLGEDIPLTVRVGRQELAYGEQRMISPWGWGRIRIRFDGLKVFWKGDNWDLDAWYTKPVVNDTTAFDETADDVSFFGGYATRHFDFNQDLKPDHDLDFYLLGQHDTTGRLNPNGRRGDKDVYTIGSAFRGESCGFDYEVEVNGQFGDWAGDDIRAWSAGGAAGYRFGDDPRKDPRLGMGFEIASGDKDPFDSNVETFDQLYRQPKDFLGYFVVTGRQNLNLVNVNLEAWLVPRKVKLNLYYYWMWLQQDRDALYLPSGLGAFPGRRDVTGDSGSSLGQEFDITLGWKIDAHSSVLFGFSHFWSGSFLDATGAGSDPEVYYCQYQIKF